MIIITTEQIKNTNTFISLPDDIKKHFLKKKGFRVIKTSMHRVQLTGFNDWNYKSETSLLVKNIIKELTNNLNK